MSIAIIAAVAENMCIGKNNELPWHIPEDLKHFKDLTTGKTVLMGRNTWLSLPEKFRPLPHRTNVVLSFDPIPDLPKEVLWFSNIDEAVERLAAADVLVIGGGMMYKQMISRASTLYITHVHQTVDGDVFFPTIDPAMWQETAREDHEKFSFVTYSRI